MMLDIDRIQETNQSSIAFHQVELDVLRQKLDHHEIDIDAVIADIIKLKVATPSWALGTGGTRFGRFPGGGEPATLEEKISDVGVLKQLSGQTASISLHIPWDVPDNAEDIKTLAGSYGLTFDSMNSNTFMDALDNGNTPDGRSYKFGSMCHNDPAVRDQAIKHNLEVIEYGKRLGSTSLTVWLADGTNFPGQASFRQQFENVANCLRLVHSALPQDWVMFTEHKPYEPNFYSTVNHDWGSNLLLAREAGERCLCLVDLGHHLPNTNIEQVVSRMLMSERLGGFHFNDSKYGDDDLTVGSLKPYQLFLIFNELVACMPSKASGQTPKRDLAWMIDASHNTKDPLEDLLQSLDAIAIAYAQALIIPRSSLYEAQQNNDAAMAQEILQEAYRTDVRPMVREARLRQDAALHPIQAYRALKIRKQLIAQRGTRVAVSGL